MDDATKFWFTVFLAGCVVIIFAVVLAMWGVYAQASESPQRDLLKADLRDDCFNNQHAKLYQRLAAQKGEGDGVRLAREGGIVVLKHYNDDMKGVWK